MIQTLDPYHLEGLGRGLHRKHHVGEPRAPACWLTAFKPRALTVFSRCMTGSLRKQATLLENSKQSDPPYENRMARLLIFETKLRFATWEALSSWQSSAELQYGPRKRGFNNSIVGHLGFRVQSSWLAKHLLGARAWDAARRILAPSHTGAQDGQNAKHVCL